MKLKADLLTISTLLASACVVAEPTITISTTTNSRNFPLNPDQPLVVPLVKDSYTIDVIGIDGNCEATEPQKVLFNQPIQLNCGATTSIPLKIRFTGDYSFRYDANEQTLLFKREAKKAKESVFKRPIPNVECETYQGGEITLNLGDSFADGTLLRDAYSDQIVTVRNQQISILPSPKSGGLVLLEPVERSQQNTPFTYRNANIYFVMIDRFNNADPSNDNSYGRRKDGLQEVGTFHGGDLKGVIEKLDYIASLGTNVIWLSPIVEQVHGFVGGGEKGSFPFYAYHGYWTRDFTKIDANLGNEEDLKTLVTEAHKRGIKVLLDAVLNHSGYATLADLQLDNIEVTSANTPSASQWQPNAQQSWHDVHQFIDYQNPNWTNWWGPDWVRAGLPSYDAPGSSDITMTLAGLPDFKTESAQSVTPPNWLLANPGTRVEAREHFTVADYLIEWQTDWVKRFGIDGYRVDTVKHVERDVWLRLKQEASSSLEQWREQHDQTGQPFWMMGEVWGHAAYRSPYFDDGFDALINFDMQKKLDKGAVCFSQMADTYQHYANTLKKEPDFNPVSYMSSHDTELFFSRFKNYDLQRNAASALLLSPGAIQVFYGDEVGRDIGPYADDFHQGTRSDMAWQLSLEQQELLEHWQKIGQFRQTHPAVGAGEQQIIKQKNAFVFSRTYQDDKVIIAFVGNSKK